MAVVKRSNTTSGAKLRSRLTGWGVLPSHETDNVEQWGEIVGKVGG